MRIWYHSYTTIFLALVLFSAKAHSDDSRKEECCLTEYQVNSLNYAKILDCAFDVSIEDIRSIFSSIDYYFSNGTTNPQRYMMLSPSYKSALKRSHNIDDGIDYFVPGTFYERFLWGYKIRSVCIFGDNLIQIKLQASWSQEGYSGDKTYFIEFKKINNEWKIVSVVE